MANGALSIIPDNQQGVPPITSKYGDDGYPVFQSVATGETEADPSGIMVEWVTKIATGERTFDSSLTEDQQFADALRQQAPQELAQQGIAPALAQAALGVIGGAALNPNARNVAQGKGLIGLPQNQAQEYITNYGLDPVKTSGGNTYFNTAAFNEATYVPGLDPAQMFPDGRLDFTHETGAGTLFNAQGASEGWQMPSLGGTAVSFFANLGSNLIGGASPKQAIKTAALGTAGAVVGGFIGSSFGPLGSAVGSMLGSTAANLVGSGSIICTELHRQGKISDTQRRILTHYTLRNMTPTHFKGYYIWAPPVVKQLKQGRLVGLFTFLINRWTNHILYQGGIRKKRDWTGQIIASVGERLTWALGRAYELTEKRRTEHAHA